MKQKLDFLANIVIVVLGLTVTVSVIHKHFRSKSQAPAVIGSEVGDTLNLPGELHPGEAELSLIVAVAPDCDFCTRSMPFYRTMVAHRDAAAAPLRIVAVVRDEGHVEQELAALVREGVHMDAVVPADFRELGIPGTPMLITVDDDGQVQGAWLGKLDETEEQDVLSALGISEGSTRRASLQ